MKSRNSNLLNVIKFYLFYVSIVLIVTPLGVYLISFLSEEEYWEPLDEGVWTINTHLGHVYE